MHQPTVKQRQICEAKRWLGAMASQGDCKEATDILANETGLSAITAAWEALLAAEREAKQELFDDVSTDAGSDLPEWLGAPLWEVFIKSSSDLRRSSSCSAYVVRLSVSSTSSWPGPGCYTPNWEALRPRLAKGAPCFKRYSGRESKEIEAEAEAAEAEIEMLSQRSSVVFTCPGGKIQPLPRTRPRSCLTSLALVLF